MRFLKFVFLSIVEIPLSLFFWKVDYVHLSIFDTLVVCVEILIGLFNRHIIQISYLHIRKMSGMMREVHLY